MTVLFSESKRRFKTGDLVIWESITIDSFFDLALFLYQKILRAKYIHVGVVVLIRNRPFVLEATPPVVRLHPLSMMTDFYHLPINRRVTPANLNNLFLKLGKKYSLLDFFRMIFNMKNDTYSYYCSELASAFYNDIGLIKDRLAGKTPDSIVEAVEKVTGNKPLFIHIDKGSLNVV